MYFVTKHVVPPDQVPIFSWIQGWCNLLGQTAGVSSVAYTVSQMLLACVSMNSDLVDGKYSYAPYVSQPQFYISKLIPFKNGAGDRVSVNRNLMHSWGDFWGDYLYLHCADYPYT
ncbi:hypothetical protein ACN38_g9409 [Penicillium nordicum]|uniref:Uncharacterized protein n=1 Tax=Penicillium nordicum TaxID=229535 RepID=A0A0M9WCK2_9EURO|nr:hypothetical protein ACN38_g9409 [Penicillium nordicum]